MHISDITHHTSLPDVHRLRGCLLLVHATCWHRYLAQQYINQPLLINGRKFGIRLWVLVPGAEPLRVYLHRNGLALFSEARYQPAGVLLFVLQTYNVNSQECCRRRAHSTWRWFGCGLLCVVSGCWRLVLRL